jgi:hypothetical protein
MEDVMEEEYDDEYIDGVAATILEDKIIMNEYGGINHDNEEEF